MSVISLTGSGDLRIENVQKNWIVFEPVSDFRLYQNPLYTVPLGQTYGAEMIINSGSVSFSSSVLSIVKNIHIFDNDLDADSFISDIGLENVSSISRKQEEGLNGELVNITEVHLIDQPRAKFEFDIINCPTERGFKVEIFASGSNGLYEIEKKAIINANGDLISDTFLKYFEIEVDVND